MRRAHDIALRTLAGVCGGYAVASGFATAAAALAPAPRASVLLAAILFSFAIHALLIVWAFADRSVLRVMAVIAVLALVLNGAGHV